MPRLVLTAVLSLFTLACQGASQADPSSIAAAEAREAAARPSENSAPPSSGISQDPTIPQTADGAFTPGRPPTFTYEVIAAYPHGTEDFTQGLFIAEGVLYESTGQVGRSHLIRHSILGNAEEVRMPLPPHVFGEGSVAVGDKVISLTWRDGVGHVHALDTLEMIGEFPVAGEGWGLTYDGTRLIMSDGTNRLRFLDPNSYEEIGDQKIFVGTRPLPRLNELEWIGDQLWANIWQTDVLARIDIETGQVTGFANLSGLYPGRRQGFDEVLNGIAYDPKTDRLFVTGKNWPQLFEIRLTLAPIE